MPLIVNLKDLSLKDTISFITSLYYNKQFNEAKELLPAAFKKAK